MQRLFILILLSFIPTLILASSPRLETVQISGIANAISLDIIHASGYRSRKQLAGIRMLPRFPIYHRALEKRLQVLAMGRPLQMQSLNNQTALFFYGGENLSARLLSEGLVVIDPLSLQWLTLHQQQQLIEALEQARNKGLGIWSEAF